MLSIAGSPCITVARNLEREHAGSEPEDQRPQRRAAPTSQIPAEATILALQGSAGNRAVARALLQRTPRPVETWEDCRATIDSLVEAWIKPKYEQYIDRVYFAHKPGQPAQFPA